MASDAQSAANGGSLESALHSASFDGAEAGGGDTAAGTSARAGPDRSSAIDDATSGDTKRVDTRAVRAAERALADAAPAPDDGLTCEEVLTAIGSGYKYNAGPFQRRIFLVSGLCGWIAMSWHVMGIVFLLDPDNPSSAASQFGMTPVQVGLVGSITFAGWGIGTYGITWLADRRGRLYVGLRAFVAVEALVFMSAVMPTYPLFCLVYFMIGCTAGGAGAVLYVLLIEFAPPAFRGFAASMLNMNWVPGSVLIAVLAWLCPDWRLQSVLSTIPGLATIALMRRWPPSPRYLLAKGRTDEALAVLRAIAAENGRPMPDKGIKVPKGAGKQGEFGELFKYKTLRIQTLSLFLCWFASSMVYYGLSFEAGDLAGDIHGNAIMLALVEAPSYLACLYLVDHPAVGRRKAQAGFFLESGVFLVVLVFGVEGTARTACALAGKFGISAAFVVVYIYAGELFPTSVKSVGLGGCNVASRFGGVLAPMLIRGTSPELALLIFGFVGLAAGFVTLLLPETLGRVTPETVADEGAVEANDNGAAAAHLHGEGGDGFVGVELLVPRGGGTSSGGGGGRGGGGGGLASDVAGGEVPDFRPLVPGDGDNADTRL